MTRELLYRAATELFVERGYEDTTMADIAERAGTARRTAFNHFPNKGDIPMMWARLMADRAVEAFAAHAEDRTVERITPTSGTSLAWWDRVRNSAGKCCFAGSPPAAPFVTSRSSWQT